MDEKLFILPLVFVAGYICQRGRTCAVSAAYEIAKRRRARRFLGFLYAAAWSLLIVSIAAMFRPDLLRAFNATLPTVWTISGAVVFGLGAAINGRCSLGTISRLGSGDLVRIGTLLGIFVGIAIAARLLPHAMTVPGATVLLVQAPLLRIAIALGAVVLLAIILRHYVPRDFVVGQWTIGRAMTAIGIVNGLLIWFAHNWSYTSFFRLVSMGGMAPVLMGLGIFAVLIAGSVTAGLVSRQFRLSAGLPREWIRAIIGGLLMGVGVFLIPGGNDTMLLVGLPLLLPQLIAAYGVMYVTLIVIAYFSRTQA